MNKKLTVVFIFLLTVTAKAQTSTKSHDGILWLGLENRINLIDTPPPPLKHPLLKSPDATAWLEANQTFIVNVTNYKSVGQTIQLDLYDSLSTGSKKISSHHFLVKSVPSPL